MVLHVCPVFMDSMIEEFILTFIPIFVAIDVIGLLPVFVGLTNEFDYQKKKIIIIQSLFTALALTIGFIFLGRVIFAVLGITIGDFMVAGGLVLFCIALMDLLGPGETRRVPDSDLGAVPLGTPLIAGPAVLTTSLLLVESHGLYLTLASVFANILLVGFVFIQSLSLMRFLGKAGSRALSKIMSLLLAAIAVMIIRKGLSALLGVSHF